MGLLDIKKAIADLYDISVSDIDGRRRIQPVGIARQLAYYYARKFLGYTYESIGEMFNRDHAAVLFGVRKIEGYLLCDWETKDKVELLEQRFPKLKELVLR